MTSTYRHRERGTVLIVGLIMVAIISLIMASVFILSSSNLQAVSNQQMQVEAVAAADRAIESTIGSDFSSAPAAETVNVDIDANGTTDYVVAIETPTCIRAAIAGSAAPSDVELPTSMSAGSTWLTYWDINATVTAQDGSGAETHVRQGVRVLMSDSQKNSVCP